jgi:RNA polymerase sigma-70 factor (ECF subfamily)
MEAAMHTPDRREIVVAAPADLVEVNWDAAIRRHNHRVIVSLLALGISIDMAEDLANQAWMRLIEQHRDGKLPEVRLPGLAIRQARFLAINALKKRNTEINRSIVADDLFSPLASRDPSPEAQLLTREQLRCVMETLEGCNDSARAVFFHVYSDPAPSHAEVAERVGLSLQRVRQILCEVRKKMRLALETET